MFSAPPASPNLGSNEADAANTPGGFSAPQGVANSSPLSPPTPVTKQELGVAEGRQLMMMVLDPSAPKEQPDLIYALFRVLNRAGNWELRLIVPEDCSWIEEYKDDLFSWAEQLSLKSGRVSQIKLHKLGPDQDEGATRETVQHIIQELVPACDAFVGFDHTAWSEQAKALGKLTLIRADLGRFPEPMGDAATALAIDEGITRIENAVFAMLYPPKPVTGTATVECNPSEGASP